MKILSSASRLVLLAVTVTVCIAFLILVIRGTIVLDPKDYFSLVLMVFAYYFGQKNTNAPVS